MPRNSHTQAERALQNVSSQDDGQVSQVVGGKGNPCIMAVCKGRNFRSIKYSHRLLCLENKALMRY